MAQPAIFPHNTTQHPTTHTTMKPLTLTILLLGLFHSSAGERLRGRKLAAGGVAEGVALAAVYEVCDFSSRINSIPFIGSSEVARSSEDCKAAVQRACSQAGEVASCNTAIACLMGRTETKDPCAALAANGAKTATRPTARPDACTVLPSAPAASHR